MKIRLLIISIVLAIGLASARADVRMPAIFGDHMVLQQSVKLPVWGKADPGEKITVTIGNRTGSTTADAAGKWRVNLDPLADSVQPTSMTIAGEKHDHFLRRPRWRCLGLFRPEQHGVWNGLGELCRAGTSQG